VTLRPALAQAFTALASPAHRSLRSALPAMPSVRIACARLLS
jgi:hypothetical protein